MKINKPFILTRNIASKFPEKITHNFNMAKYHILIQCNILTSRLQFQTQRKGLFNLLPKFKPRHHIRWGPSYSQIKRPKGVCEKSDDILVTLALAKNTFKISRLVQGVSSNKTPSTLFNSSHLSSTDGIKNVSQTNFALSANRVLKSCGFS